MNISSSPFIQTQYGSPYQRRQVENETQREQLLEEQQRKQNQANEIPSAKPEQLTPQRVRPNTRSADIGQPPPSPERAQQNNKKLEEAIELKPLVISEQRHPGANAFVAVANMDSDFHIIDTYA
ncbi:hypothetical protein TDB9533_02977 [Thalassocella blandensis]|nr:hypothetical protein TDB9533_02977 [Thalassocella blandensis]